MKFSRSAWSKFLDWFINLCLIVVVALGLMFLAAVVALGQGPNHPINPHTQIAWPACAPGATVYSIVTNTCVPTGGGPGGNPAGVAGNFQCNGGGVFGTCLGVNADGASGMIVTGGVNAATLGGIRYAKQWQTGGGNNGIANALAPGQFVVADPSYATTEAQPFGGTTEHYYSSLFINGPKGSSPLSTFNDYRYGVPQWISNGSAIWNNRGAYWPTFNMNDLGNEGFTGTFVNPAGALWLNTTWFKGSRNFYNDKSNLINLLQKTFKYTEGQEESNDSFLWCFGNGDCAGQSQDVISFGGPSTQGDEANKATRYENIEGGEVFSGTAATVSVDGTNGFTTLTTGAQTFNGFQGEGRILIDRTSLYNTGWISSIFATGGEEHATCGGGCNWDGTYGTSTKTILTIAVKDPVDGTNSFPQTGTVLNVVSSAGFTPGNRACVFDYDYECEKITAVGTGTVTLATDRRPHPIGSYVTTGGLAGATIELVADTVSPGATNGMATMPDDTLQSTVRNAVPIMYSIAGNQIAFFNSGNALPNVNAGYKGRAYSSMNGSGATCSVTVSGGSLATITASGGSGYTGGAPQIVLTGSWTNQPIAQTTGWNSSGVSAAAIIDPGAGIVGTPTCTVVTSNPYNIYPSAKTIQVYNTTTGSVDGSFITEPWSIATPSVGHTIEQPHYFWQHTDGITNFYVGQYIPPVPNAAHSVLDFKMPGSWNGPNDRFMSVINPNSPLLYQNYPLGQNRIGLGQALAPDWTQITGSYNRILNLDSPPTGPLNGQAGVIRVGCGSLTCAQWTQPYYVWYAKGATQDNGIYFNPSTETATSVVKNFDFSHSTLSLGTPSITAQGGLISQVGQNWNPNSNALTAGTWSTTPFTTVTLDAAVLDPFGGHQSVWKIAYAGGATLGGVVDVVSTPFTASAPLAGSVWVYATTPGLTMCSNITGIGSNNCINPIPVNTWTRLSFTATASASFLNNGSFVYIAGTTAANIWIYNPVAEQNKTFSTSFLVNNTSSSITTDTPVNQASEGLDSTFYKLNGVVEGSPFGLPGPLDSDGGLTLPRVTLSGTPLFATGTPSNSDVNGILTAVAGTAARTFANTYVSAPVCVVQDDTTISNLLTKTVTNTTLTVTTIGATDQISYVCVGRD